MQEASALPTERDLQVSGPAQLNIFKMASRKFELQLAAALFECTRIQPPGPGSAITTGAGRLVWWQPGAWILKEDPSSSESVADAVESVAAAVPIHTAELGSHFLAFEICGSRWRELLTRGCSLEVFAPAFAPGFATRTTLGAFDVAIDVVEQNRCELLVMRSFAEDFATWLRSLSVALADSD